MFGRFRFLVRRQRFEENLADEVSFHLETRIEDLVSRGVPREQAERRARLEFGSVDAYKERCRESGGLRPFDELAQDLRYAFRVYRKSPGVAALAILCLALGIGANTSVFSMMNYLMLKPLPVPGAERVVVLERGPRTDLSYPYYRAYRDRSRSFSGLAASQPTESTLDIGNEASGAAAEAVSANYASVLRLRAHLGRWFDNENEAAAVVSYRVWQKRFNGDPNVLGKIVRSEKRYWTVVGVAPPEYSGIYSPLSTDLWVPLRLWAEQYPTVIAGLADYTRAQVMSVGRLREGVSPEQATAELNAIDVRAREENGDKRPRQPLLANPARGILPKHFRHGAGPLSVLLMAVGTVVLFIACLNVANLLLAKGIARQTEIGVRMSLGAGLRRVFRQMLAESLLLSVFGAAAGLLAGQ